MSTFLIGIRKYVESDELHYWLLITAKPAALEEQDGERKVKFTSVSLADLYIQGINAIQWKIFMIMTILLNIFIYISYFWLGSSTKSLRVIVPMHFTCFVYWLDFIGAVMEKVRSRKRLDNPKIRSTLFLVLDTISLLPLSTVYLIVVRDIDSALLWELRAITLIRFYRVPRFCSQISRVERNHWNVVLSAYSCYFLVFIVVFANLFLWKVDEYTPINIANWNTTNFNRMVVSFYYALQMTCNVGYGDIGPKSYFQIIFNSLALFLGTAFSSGILSGILAITFTNKAKRREYYRYEFEATRKTLVERKIDKEVVNNILDNMTTIWRYKNGYTDPPVYILPLSLRKELYFDVNFSHLKHSLIFSMKPRSFLRSVAILMKNLTYLPGDIIMEPSGMSDAMICVASGVIEVLSQDSDDSVLFSLTMGTIIGEATLFIPLPIRCKIRASTYVELQVLKKVDFFRLSLTYPDIFRSMRSEIYFRLQFKEDMTTMHANVLSEEKNEGTRRKTKKFLRHLKNDMDLEEMGEDKFYTYKAAILRLYILSENIPRVKTLPINLIRAKPWILRPNTPLTKLWNLSLVTVVIAAAIIYPIWAGFHRKIEPWVYAVLVIFKGFYVVDVYLECTIAISRKDNFTYVTSIKQIIAQKLKTVGFYLDVLSTYHLTIYSNLLWPDHVEYIHLLLSLNALLKTWRTVVYMKELENDMKNNLLFIVSVKYVIWIVIITTWAAVILYLEARPGDDYVEGRWLYQIKNDSSIPTTASPTVVSFYFAASTLLALGYGDMVPTTITDCVVVIVCIIAGFILCVVYMSETSAAIKHSAKIRTSYQEELLAVDRFMSEHEIPKEFQQRVRQYLRLQWDYDKGYSLKQISISTVLPGLQKHILVMELFKTFLCVPLFRNTSPDFIKLLAKLCKVRVLPPNETVTEIGSYIREMYIIENGYCRVTYPEASHSKIIGPLAYFGFLVMVSGREHQIRVETLTHVRIVSLNYTAYLNAMTKYPGMEMDIENAIANYYDDENEFEGSTAVTEEEEEEQNKADLEKKFLSKAFVNVYAYHKKLPDKYWAPFRKWGKYRIFQFLFLPFSILPNSLFLRIWMTIRIINALIIGIIAPIQFSILDDDHIFMKFIIVLQVLAAVDMYLMFHVAYYNKRGLLIFHPAKTATHYLKGNFALDLIAVFPYYWVVLAMYPKKHKHLGFFANTFGLIIVLQLYKYFLGWHHIEADILRKTTVIKIIKLFPFLLLVINFITALVILIQCHKVRNTNISEIAGDTKMAHELADSVMSFCFRCTNRTCTENIDHKKTYKMYLVTLYWVTETITICGFGDIRAHNESTMVVVIVMVVLGIFFFTYVFGSLTRGMVNTNILISKHRRRILRMMKFMKNKNVHPHLQERLILHYEYNWQRTEGASPQDIFSFLHSALREKIVSSMYEETLSQNPAFQDLEKVIVTIIGRNLEELYFLQGETIVKYKDLQEHIYLIYRGEVHLISSNGQLITSMGRGGMFGNITNKSFFLSSETVIAAENVDLVRLDRKIFFLQLQNFPNTKGLISYLTTREQNYIEPKTKMQPLEAIPPTMTLNIFRLRTVAAEHMGTQSSYIYGVSDYRFKNTIFFLRKSPSTTFVIMPGTALHNTIENFISTMAFLSANLTMYMFAFQDSYIGLIVLLYVCDLFFLFEIYLQLHMSYPDKFGDCAVSMSTIKRRYLRSNKLFFDVLTNCPLEIMVFFGSYEWRFRLISILRLNRIFRLHYMFSVYYKKKKRLMTNKIYLESCWIFILTIQMIHTLACIWFVAVCPLGFFEKDTWVSEMDLTGRNAWELYIYSAFYIITIATSTGYQALEIYSVPEVVLALIFMLITRVAIFLFCGLLAATVNANSLNLFMFQQKIIELKETFSRQNIGEYQLEKMWNYLTTLWDRDEGKQMPKFISLAPYTMKCEVMTAMFGNHLSQSFIFSNTDATFLRQLASHLKRFVYFPGNYIVQQGDIDYTMYFIHTGEVSVLTIHPELIETIHFKLSENDNFGLQQGLIIGKAHNFSYRAETDVEILSLTLSNWQHLLKYFPQVAQEINKRVEKLPDKAE